jgi:hypothetical protein
MPLTMQRARVDLIGPVLLTWATFGAAACASGEAFASGEVDSDADTGTEIVGDPCANYPASDDDFAVGSVPRNYTFYDADDVERRLCELADKRLALLVISGGES